MLSEVTDIHLLIYMLILNILITVHRLFSCMTTTRIVMITGLVELLHLIDGIVVLSCILTELTLVTLMDGIAGTSGCSLLTKFGLGNSFGN